MVKKPANFIKKIFLYEEYTEKIDKLEDKVSNLEKENAAMQAVMEIIQKAIEVKLK